MFQLIVDGLLVAFALYGFLTFFFWVKRARSKTAEATDAKEDA